MFLNVPGQPIVCFTFFITYCSSFVIAEMEDILNMRINRFHHLNISGQLIPLDDSIKTEMYVTCISMIGVDFQFAHSMTDNLMTYLLLNIDHWHPNSISQADLGTDVTIKVSLGVQIQMLSQAVPQLLTSIDQQYVLRL